MLSTRHVFKKTLKLERMVFIHVSLSKRKVTVSDSKLVCLKSDIEIYTLSSDIEHILLI